ncbi:hypothetical protein DE146DRAFT_628544 [Phaeosphaeria sp. MPI-PUGE-AT-0046c]|nr:hypothetical protein DE146DRAFT_628544 [Phaeosphaeria sp. MPI-PUGE-AT-0046c]
MKLQLAFALFGLLGATFAAPLPAGRRRCRLLIGLLVRKSQEAWTRDIVSCSCIVHRPKLSRATCSLKKYDYHMKHDLSLRRYTASRLLPDSDAPLNLECSFWGSNCIADRTTPVGAHGACHA